MSSSSGEESSEDGERANVDLSFLLQNNGEVTPFSFQPMYSEVEIEERLNAYRYAKENPPPNINEFEDMQASTDINWCPCKMCSPMQSEAERKCCKDSCEIPDSKFDKHQCITESDGFREVCLLKNVLEAALGAWHIFKGEKSDLSNKSYRFIAYKQYIYWIHGRLGRNIRIPIPSCAVNKIRKTFPAPNNIYIPYTESSL